MKFLQATVLLALSCFISSQEIRSLVDEENNLDLSVDRTVDFVGNVLDEQPTARIVGGEDAVEGQFPFQVSLRENRRAVCGGAIISQNYVVTAAHCVSKVVGSVTRVTPASHITLRVGSSLVHQGGTIVDVSQVKLHPQYRNFNNDIALLKLRAPLKFTNLIKPIPLATQNVPSNGRVVISGWGRLRDGGTIPRRLQFTTLTALTTPECQRRIGKHASESILCLAHGVGNGGCYGDSGGPAEYDGKLVGVTSFVIGRCGSSAPDGFSKISFHLNWLKTNSDL